jgi:hypothetical protein
MFKQKKPSGVGWWLAGFAFDDVDGAYIEAMALRAVSTL